MQKKYRVGIDAGGTFTDVILADRDGEVRIFKALSTPQDPTLAIRNGLALIEEETGITAREIASQSDLCINGTTVGLNALIQHKGARTGLIATRGHEDSIEIRLGHKEDGYRYDPEYPPATMLVPRRLRRGVRERVLSTGEVRTPMVDQDVRDACTLFIAEGIETTEQEDYVAGLGCAAGQGYLFARPMPREHIAGYLAGTPNGADAVSPRITPLRVVRSNA